MNIEGDVRLWAAQLQRGLVLASLVLGSCWRVAAASAQSAVGGNAAAVSGGTAPATATVAAIDRRYSAEWLTKQLSDYHRRYPKLTRLVKAGTSHEGRTVWALAIGRNVKLGDTRPSVLLNGAHHGLEMLSVDMVMDAIDVLLLRSRERKVALRPDPELDAQVKRWLDELVIWCVPTVNPDGVWATQHGNPRSGRKNGRDNNKDGKVDRGDGVDLNRNYPFQWGALGEKGSSAKAGSAYFRGPRAASEPETQAMMRLAEAEHFAAAISFHTGNVAVLAPYTIAGVKNPAPNEAWSLAEQLIAGLPPHPQGKPWAVRENLYPVDGTDQDWHRFQFGTAAYIVEGARSDAKDELEREAVLQAVRPTWMRLLQRFSSGPTLFGYVHDAAGKPVVAEVAIEQIQPAAGEVWRSRCRDGLYARFLPAPGHYTVRVTVPGQPALIQSIEVTERLTQLDLSVPTPAAAQRCPPIV